MRKLTFVLALLLGIGLLVPEDAFARGRGGFGGGRSSGWGRRSSPSRSVPRSSPRSSSRSNSSKSWGKSSKSRSTAKPQRKMTAADKKLADKAKKQGTSFKDRKAATSNFKEKYSKQYTSKYATKPATRPSHIPQSTTVDGKTYNVTYNQQYGGYGYMGPLGTWIMYDMFTDAIMMNMMMRQHGYYHPGMNSGTVVHTGPDAGVVLCIILGGLLLIFIVGIGIKVLMES